MYRIRFHGRGGQGMKTANQILGSAFFLQGFEVQDAPRYGAERRGAPIFAYLRASRAPIHERGAITRPDLVVVADETLIPVPAAGVLQGVSAHTVLLVNSADSGVAAQARGAGDRARRAAWRHGASGAALRGCRLRRRSRTPNRRARARSSRAGRAR
jgi:2-oxoacid:acceptor oxidoreductase gamma subunit (pyruvate/2-ketoisovalerate family)